MDTVAYDEFRKESFIQYTLLLYVVIDHCMSICLSSSKSSVFSSWLAVCLPAIYLSMSRSMSFVQQGARDLSWLHYALTLFSFVPVVLRCAEIRWTKSQVLVSLEALWEPRLAPSLPGLLGPYGAVLVARESSVVS